MWRDTWVMPLNHDVIVHECPGSFKLYIEKRPRATARMAIILGLRSHLGICHVHNVGTVGVQGQFHVGEEERVQA